MAAARDQIERRARRTSKRPRERPKKGARATPASPQISQAYEKKVSELVLDSRFFPTNEELASYLNGIGLDVSFHKKDGRDRIRRKLLRSLQRTPVSERDNLVSRILAALPKTETAGWFEAIRGERR